MTALVRLDRERSRAAIAARSPRPGGGPPTTPRPAPGPDPERLIAAVARYVLEVECSRRPLWQLEPVLTPSVARRVARRHRRLQVEARRTGSTIPGPGPGTIVKLICQTPAEGVCEATVILRVGERVTSMSVRAERWRGGWRVVELARPEDALEPLRCQPGTRE